jgi:hypothetical protein
VKRELVDEGAEAVQYATPLTGVTLNASAAGTYVVNPAGTIAALTINFPTSPYDGQEWGYMTTQIVTALTLAATGKTIVGGPTAGTANGFARFKYRHTNATWYRIG